MENIIEKKAIVFAVENNQYLSKKFLEDVPSASDLRYTTGFKGKVVKKGISLAEETKMPELWNAVNADPKSPNFIESVNEYWNDFEVLIPSGIIEKGIVDGGMTLDAGYRVDESTGYIYPNNFINYALYNLMIDDDTVCKDIANWDGRGNYNYFMISNESVEKIAQESLDQEIKITEVLHKALTFDLDTIKNLVKVYSKQYVQSDIEAFTILEAKQAIVKMAKEEKEGLTKGVSDTKLGVKAKIAEYITYGLITEQQDAFYIKEDKIANKKSELTLYVENAVNQKVIFDLDKQVLLLKKREIENA